MDKDFLVIAEAFLRAVTGELDPYTSEKGEITTDTKEGSVNLTNPYYIQFAKYGRGPGKKPPIDNILKWVKSKGIKIAKTDIGTAFAIQAKIGREGTNNWVPNAPNAIQEAINLNLGKYYDEVNQKILVIETKELNELYKEQFPPTTDFKI